MDLFFALGLIVVLLLAMNHMAGGHHSAVLRPVSGIASRLVSLAFKTVTRMLSAVFRLAGPAVKLPGPNMKKPTDRGAGPPPPRWKD